MQGLKIAVVGAGPAGCMLARLLHLAGIEVTVFEGDASPNYRSQGGSLDLHTKTGLAAMKEAGLFEDFLKLARYDGEFMMTTDRNLKPYMTIGAGGVDGNRPVIGQRPEIDRPELRKLLTEALPAGMVQWGHRLKRVDADDTLVFADGKKRSGFDLVVGADGAWSKVRQLLSDQKPSFTGVGMHTLTIPDAMTTAPEVVKLVNRGTVFCSADGLRVGLQTMGDGTVNIGVFRRLEDEKWAEPDHCGYDAHDFAAVRDVLLREDGGILTGWHPTIREAIAKGSARCEPRNLYMLPVGFSWPHRRGATVIGDAAHVMTPFAGEGVNVAFDDARKLAATIVGAAKQARAESMDQKATLGALDAAVAGFESEMFVRAGDVASLTDQLTQLWMFTAGAPGSVIASATALHVRRAVPRVMGPVATGMVHSYFFAKKLMG